MEGTEGQQTSTPAAPALPQAENSSREPVAGRADSDAGETKTKHQSFETALRANLRKASALKSEPKKAEPTPAAPKVEPQPVDPKNTAPAAQEPPKVEAPKPLPAPVLAPQDMSPEEKAAFEKADPALQSYLSRRSVEFRQKIGQQSEQWKKIQDELGPVAPVVKEHYTHMLKRGKNVAEVVDNAIRWDQHIESDPVAGLLDYAESWGVTPDELAEAFKTRGSGAATQPQQQTQQQPQQAQRSVQDEIASYFEQEQKKQAVLNATTELQSWVKSKPHFADPGTAAQLEAAMTPVVAALRSADPTAKTAALLDEALEIVLRREPFAPLRQAIEARAQAERTRTEAEEALRSSRSISGGPGSAIPKVKYKDFAENFRANLRK